MLNINQALDNLRQNWTVESLVSNNCKACELECMGDKEGKYKYLRLATGGMSDNEDLINEFLQTPEGRYAFKLYLRGGLYIFQYN